MFAKLKKWFGAGGGDNNGADCNEQVFVVPTRFSTERSRQQWISESIRRGAVGIGSSTDAETLKQLRDQDGRGLGEHLREIDAAASADDIVAGENVKRP